MTKLLGIKAKTTNVSLLATYPIDSLYLNYSKAAAEDVLTIFNIHRKENILSLSADTKNLKDQLASLHHNIIGFCTDSNCGNIAILDCTDLLNTTFQILETFSQELN